MEVCCVQLRAKLLWQSWLPNPKCPNLHLMWSEITSMTLLALTPLEPSNDASLVASGAFHGKYRSNSTRRAD